MPLLLLALLFLAACTPATAPTPPPPFSGSWVVSDTLLARASDTLRIEGTMFQFTAEQAVVPSDTCATPTYATETVEATDYLRNNFGLSPAELGFQDATLQATQIQCNGTFWHTPGSWVLQQDSLTLIPWNEVFLKVRPEAP